MPPLVSICLPTLNARRFLEPRMESILAQTLGDWQLIVCDSHSNDRTWEYFQKFRDDHRIRLHQVPREGIYAGWNECLRRATGEYVYVATADDTCQPTLLEMMVGALEKAEGGRLNAEGKEEEREEFPHKATKETKKQGDRCGGVSDQSGSRRSEDRGQRSEVRGEHPASSIQRPATSISGQPRLVDIAVCDFDFIDENGRVMSPRPRPVPGDFYAEWNDRAHVRSGLMELLVHLYLGVSWTTMTAMVFRRSLLEKTGEFRVDCGAHGDKLWAVCSALNSDTVYWPERLATWRCHSGQRSNQGGQEVHGKILKLTRETLERNAHLIPSHWKAGPQWLNILLSGARSRYMSGYKLDRAWLRRNPLAFLAGVLRAAVREPAYLLQRTAAGFSWDTPEMMDGHEYLRKLICAWGVPWPPDTLSGAGCRTKRQQDAR